eukprot:gnl/TRDRNA2_/TRDRNA2_85223_c0_seq1.p1 gnl/TRDRNA2_/TRDRNA2_85223_c0~~gnl/TRDRNA2_/TRDRNA2_85223_c0_seq1.p1  ORF type:complete len:365 (-),score=86.29 gnl/TRDRNA2_/TRDRNA2_85223_c0_seq1:170-1264(-)
MMQSIIAKILLGATSLAYTKEIVVSGIDDTDNQVLESLGHVQDAVMVSDRLLKTSPLLPKDLDSTVLGKPTKHPDILSYCCTQCEDLPSRHRGGQLLHTHAARRLLSAGHRGTRLAPAPGHVKGAPGPCSRALALRALHVRSSGKDKETKLEIDAAAEALLKEAKAGRSQEDREREATMLAMKSLVGDFWDASVGLFKDKFGKKKEEEPEPVQEPTEPKWLDLKPVFNQWDRDGNGMLEPKELINGLKAVGLNQTAIQDAFNPPSKKGEIVGAFMALDADGDGHLKFEEFDANLPEVLRIAIEGKLNKDLVMDSLYVPPENMKDASIDGERQWEEFVQFQALREGNQGRQNEILGDELRKGENQ